MPHAMELRAPTQSWEFAAPTDSDKYVCAMHI
jgi:hypothetical protein